MNRFIWGVKFLHPLHFLKSKSFLPVPEIQTDYGTDAARGGSRFSDKEIKRCQATLTHVDASSRINSTPLVSKKKVRQNEGWNDGWLQISNSTQCHWHLNMNGIDEEKRLKALLLSTEQYQTFFCQGMPAVPDSSDRERVKYLQASNQSSFFNHTKNKTELNRKIAQTSKQKKQDQNRNKHAYICR